MKLSVPCGVSETVILDRTLQKTDILVNLVLDADLSMHLHVDLKSYAYTKQSLIALHFPGTFVLWTRVIQELPLVFHHFCNYHQSQKIYFQGHEIVNVLLEILTSTPKSVWLFLSFFTERKAEKVT